MRFLTDRIFPVVVLSFFFLPTFAIAQVELPWRQDVWFDDFANFRSNDYFIGSATRHDAFSERMILTPERGSTAGRLVLRRLLPIASFDASIRASFGVGGSATNGGGDGIVFVFAPVDTWRETGGGSLNFNGCLGYGVEFDTYQNPEYNDPSHEHIAVIKDVTSNHLHFETLSIPTLENGRPHTLHIRLRNKTVYVVIDGIQRLNYTIDDFTEFDGYLALTAACGSAFNEHSVDDIRVAMPSRTSVTFGPYPYCAPISIDTNIIITNDHLFGNNLAITNISLSSATPGVFSIGSVPLPLPLPWQGRISLPLNIHLSGEGEWQAVLRLDSDGGESVYDTLRVSSYMPRVTWEPSELTFPVQPVGSRRDTVVYLRNSGMTDAEVNGFAATLPEVTITSLVPLPLHLRPGESVAVRIGVQPSTTGLVSDSVHVIMNCGSGTTLPIRFTGSAEYAVMSFTRPALMLQPGSEGLLALFLDTLPEYAVLYELEGSFSYSTPELRFTGAVQRGAALAADAVFSVDEHSNGVLTWHIRSISRPLDGGELLSLQFLAQSNVQDCYEVTVLSAIANREVSAAYTVPVSFTDGRICINNSCRHPEGLRYTAPPELRIYPNPIAQHSTVEIALPSAGILEVFLCDLNGKAIYSMYSGYSEAGTLTLALNTCDLPPAVYFLVLDFNAQRQSRRVVVEGGWRK